MEGSEKEDAKNNNEPVNTKINSEADAAAALEHENGRKMLMKTPESMEVRTNKDGTQEIVRSSQNIQKKPPSQKSIKDLINNKVIGELDVETNYLRASAQNFGDELHLKTVFQKRGPVAATNKTVEENGEGGGSAPEQEDKPTLVGQVNIENGNETATEHHQ